MCLPSMDAAQMFCQEMKETEGHSAWIIGSVVAHDLPPSENDALIIDEPTIIKVSRDTL